jgi:hypothetical protein
MPTTSLSSKTIGFSTVVAGFSNGFCTFGFSIGMVGFAGFRHTVLWSQSAPATNFSSLYGRAILFIFAMSFRSRSIPFLLLATTSGANLTIACMTGLDVANLTPIVAHSTAPIGHPKVAHAVAHNQAIHACIYVPPLNFSALSIRFLYAFNAVILSSMSGMYFFTVCNALYFVSHNKDFSVHFTCPLLFIISSFISLIALDIVL